MWFILSLSETNFSTTPEDNLKPDLFTKLMGLSCAIEKQIIFVLFVVKSIWSSSYITDGKAQALMTTYRI